MMHHVRLRKPDGRALHLYGRTPVTHEAPGGPAAGVPGSHLRWHPLRGEWVIVSPHRQDRTFLPTVDPLAPGPASEVPAGAWDVAVFENRFPALASGAPEPPASIVPTARAAGACEVVVYTQAGEGSLGALPLDRVDLVLAVWAQRTDELGARDDIHYVFPFENRGVEVGVTLHHPHGQIYAYPFVPPIAARELAEMREHQRVHRRGLLVSLVEAELADGRRVLYGGEHAVAFVPACARYAYETWVMPRRAVPALGRLTDDERLDLARALQTVLRKYDALWARPMPYLLLLHQAPTDGTAYPWAHTHFELYPPYRSRDRLKYLAGTEIGMGTFSADTLPEERAAELRAVDVAVG